MNFFDLFNLPTDFDLDQNALDNQLRVLQSLHHPDVQTDRAVQAKAEQMSALINHAYQTLKFPDSRAVHLLELVGQAYDLSQSIRDLDFLDLAMDLRIELDEASALDLPILIEKLKLWINDISKQFHQAYKQQDWQTAVVLTQKLKFLLKIDKDIAKKMNELAKLNDDDLYV
ncbi:co-chaperone Hsc20 [Moraxella macacae 0408225]|uniref:Co-chaperone Hsc20 n=1 Tax=Moraxella macacae 0408225 TaxID=1230338 RepID=L2F6A6_9GAMM|nr:Fe-S protein assembly co-chaperone HscB [Moraxella macacae]ELA08552.1 co-chaperone Hsc20 [Moraxella macacae 0408225]